LHDPPPHEPEPLSHDLAGSAFRSGFFELYPSAYHPPPRSAKEDREMSLFAGPPQLVQALSGGSVIRCSTSQVPQVGHSYSYVGMSFR
jgi:hypothetical protein